MNKKMQTVEEAAENYAEENARDENISYHNLFSPLEYAFRSGAEWQQQQLLNFINDEDNHTEGELGNSCIDVQTLKNLF